MLRQSILFSAATAMALTGISAPAFARGHDDHGWGRDDRRYSRPHVIYTRPVTRVVYAQPTYYQPAYYQTSSYPAVTQATRIQCNDSFNPVTGIIGGALGGIAGNGLGKGHGRTAAIITGAVLGTTIGGSAAVTTRCSEQVVYQSPQVVQASYQEASNYDKTEGRYCREYQNRSTVGGRIQETYGTACLQPDGSWEIVD